MTDHDSINMLSGRCFKDGCTDKLYGKCECEGIALFCKNHFSKHAKKIVSKGHQCLRLYFKPSEEIREPVINKLKELRDDIKKCRIKEIMNANEVIKNFKIAFGKYIDQINEAEARCNKILSILYSGEKLLDIAKDDDMESVLKCSPSNVRHKMSNWYINECDLDYKYINAVVSKNFETPFNPFRQPLEDIIESNELSFFRHSTSNFATINLDTFQISSTVTLLIWIVHWHLQQQESRKLKNGNIIGFRC